MYGTSGVDVLLTAKKEYPQKHNYLPYVILALYYNVSLSFPLVKAQVPAAHVCLMQSVEEN